ncbi:hypothetical protein RB195_020847 [Necator americanus]|uniref:Uncharacterized protein n=2 Tax=Necator americanus TaxID=51031 RepID=W2SWW0_NECAM|nr:hypothetical protein NECAME_18401 [Necator americanus]ETN73291.1 hypothetical protein NECAME_18401 [Necator americanus]
MRILFFFAVLLAVLVAACAFPAADEPLLIRTKRQRRFGYGYGGWGGMGGWGGGYPGFGGGFGGWGGGYPGFGGMYPGMMG